MIDYYAILKLQQGRLKAAMLVMGITTATELSKRSGVGMGTIGKLLNFRMSPRQKNGQWRSVTLAVSRTLGSEPSDLFPEHLDHEIATNAITGYVEQSQLAGVERRQLTPAEDIIEDELLDTVQEVLDTLTEQEQGVIRSRFWERKMLDVVGREQGVSRSRIRQIEAKALRKLRHPHRMNKLAEAYNGQPFVVAEEKEESAAPGRGGVCYLHAEGE